MSLLLDSSYKRVKHIRTDFQSQKYDRCNHLIKALLILKMYISENPPNNIFQDMPLFIIHLDGARHKDIYYLDLLA